MTRNKDMAVIKIKGYRGRNVDCPAVRAEVFCVTRRKERAGERRNLDRQEGRRVGYQEPSTRSIN
jgi:hypothetical protein